MLQQAVKKNVLFLKHNISSFMQTTTRLWTIFHSERPSILSFGLALNPGENAEMVSQGRSLLRERN